MPTSSSISRPWAPGLGAGRPGATGVCGGRGAEPSNQTDLVIPLPPQFFHGSCTQETKFRTDEWTGS